MANMKDWSRAVEMLIDAVEEIVDNPPDHHSAKECAEMIRAAFLKRKQDGNLEEFLAIMEIGGA